MLIYLQMIETEQDRSKFERIYLQYRNLMFSAAFSVLHNPEDAEDAVHHAFVKVAENIDKISEAVCPKTAAYVVTIVENKAIDLYRRKKKHPSVPLEQETMGLAIEYTGENEVARCIAALPAGYRQVLMLKYYHGYSTKETAKLLSLSTANVSKIEQRAKAKLEILCREAGVL
ncbi:MAG: RNA polymerase sigma factor [Faecousia sp.]